MRKIIIGLVIALALFLLAKSGVLENFNFETLKSSLGNLIEIKNKSPLLFILGFVLVYVIGAAFALPIVVPLSLAAGAIFGVFQGVILVSFASTIGATLSFFTSRFLLRDSIERRFGNGLVAINQGIEKDGAFYLFSLRLIPIFPFTMINLLMGLTKIRIWTFYWVSQAGMLLGTIVYVNAGTQLSQIESLRGIVSPPLLFSFALLGVLPIIAKSILAQLKSLRVYKGFAKPKKFNRNLIVIGGGAAGLVSAYIGAAVKAKVTLIEEEKMGGDCLNYGCVPSKAIIKSAKVANLIKKADNFGIDAKVPEINFKKIIMRVQEIIKQIEPHDSVERYEGLGVEVLSGHARIIDPWNVEISGRDNKQTLSTKNIIIATGAAPFVPNLPGINDALVLTSETLWDKLGEAEKPPNKIAILGGGPIGVELAQALSRLGVQITLIEMADNILIREDLEVSLFAQDALSHNGVKILTGHTALSFEKSGDQKIILAKSGEQIVRIEADEIICALGRTARIKGFGVEELGIETDKVIKTNEYMQTNFPNIYAAGDVAGPYQFTHTAAHQAWYASVNALFGSFKKFKADYRVIPAVTFMDPEIARVGLNEKEAKAQNIAYEITHYGIDDLDRAITDGAANGFIKVLTTPKSDKILGVTIIGENAGEIIAEFVLAMKWNLGLNKILSTIHSYPTWAEANKYSAGNWKRNNAPNGLLKWVQKFHDFARG